MIEVILYAEGPRFANNKWKEVGLQFERLLVFSPISHVCWSILLAVMMNYLTYSLSLSFDFSLESGAKIQPNMRLLRNLEKHSVVVPLVHADVLSSLATKPNLNCSKLNLFPLSLPWCVFISNPRNVVLLLCACVNKGCVNSL